MNGKLALPYGEMEVSFKYQISMVRKCGNKELSFKCTQSEMSLRHLRRVGYKVQWLRACLPCSNMACEAEVKWTSLS